MPTLPSGKASDCRSGKAGSSPVVGANIWLIDEVVSYRIVYPRLGVRFPYGSPKLRWLCHRFGCLDTEIIMIEVRDRD